LIFQAGIQPAATGELPASGQHPQIAENNLGSGGRRSGGGFGGSLASVSTRALAAVAAAIAAVAAVAAIAPVAAVAAVATITPVAAVAAVAAIATVATVTAVAAIAAAAGAVEKETGIRLAAAHQGHANQRHENRDSKQNSAVHPGILQINLLVP
jgi:hypothetical protein